MPSFISAAIAALSLSSLVSANVAYRRQEASLAPFPSANSSSSSTKLSQSSTRSVPIGTGSSSIISSSAAASGPGSNTTATATGTSPSTTASPTSYPFTFGGVSFFIEVDITYSGVDIDLAIVFAKRAGESLNDCLNTCASNTQCVGTAFNRNTDTCSFFSEITDGSRTEAPGITFATVTGRNNSGNNNSTSSSVPYNNGTSSTRIPTSTATNNGTSVTAVPNPGNNGTSPFPNAETIICPEYNDQVLQNNDGSQYLIRCGLLIEGTILSTRKARMIRRQATFGNDWIVDCIETCGATDTCVGTSYNSVAGTCTFFSTVDALTADANTDSAILVNEAPVPGTSSSLVPVVSTQTVTEGDVTRTITTTPLTTSTVYSTTTRTIQSCAPGVPCAAATVTEVVVAYTTVCPVSAVPTGGNNGGAVGGAATQTLTVCTACQYKPTTVTVYQCPTGVNGAPGKPVPVTTTVISVPVLAGPTGALTTSTVYQTQEHVTTTCGANGCGKATVTAVVSLYTTVCPVSSGTPGASAPGSSAPASETVVVPGTTVPASTKPAETVPATVENGSTKPAETVPATVVPGSTKKPSTTIVQYSPTSSGIVAYTGAAVKNGMGFAAMAAGVAALVL
ncbi:hypothetical protein KCU62_g2332, partial [Aureobasidium sp. EXF-3399]